MALFLTEQIRILKFAEKDASGRFKVKNSCLFGECRWVACVTISEFYLLWWAMGSILMSYGWNKRTKKKRFQTLV